MRERMRRWTGLALGLLLMGLEPCGRALAGEPYVGVDLGFAAPTQKFRNTAGVGGVITGHAGYRFFTLADTFSVSIEGMPQFVGLPIKSGVSTKGRDVESLFSFTAAPKFSLTDETMEAYFSAGGGYYTYTTGVIDDNGAGWFFGGGMNYHLGNGNQIGLFARRDQAFIRPVKGPTNEDTTYVTGGLSFTHLFEQEAAVTPVAATPPPPPVVPPVAAKKKIVLRGVNFDFDKATIRADATPILAEAVASLKEVPEVQVSVEGHTDDAGAAAYNQRLSERRAKAVAEFLAEHGISKSRLGTVGYGETRPVASNATSAGRAENRRVELRVSGD